MKRLITSVATLTILSSTAVAQGAYKKDPALAVHAGLWDFGDTRPALILGAGFTDGLTGHLDYSVNLLGSYIRYPFRRKPLPPKERLLVEADVSLRVRLFTDARAFTPYTSIGAGVSVYGPVTAAFTPLGAGAQFRLGNGVFLYAEVQYRAPLSGDATRHLVYSAGLSGNLRFRKKSLMQTPAFQPSAVVEFPDLDRDGIADSADNCPAVYGFARYQGCPIPDTDGDGVNDEADSCPTVPGLPRYNGCPVPDSDSDSLNDEQDKCPFVAGPVSNDGCPIPLPALQESFDSIARHIFFETGKAEIKQESFRQLNEIAAILKAAPSIRLAVEGHTDNIGTAGGNMKLSQKRAAAVVEYLVGMGVGRERLVSSGFGDTAPGGPNKTAAGRAANRRVRLRIIH